MYTYVPGCFQAVIISKEVRWPYLEALVFHKTFAIVDVD